MRDRYANKQIRVTEAVEFLCEAQVGRIIADSHHKGTQRGSGIQKDSQVASLHALFTQDWVTVVLRIT